jgi:hypothetical protein
MFRKINLISATFALMTILLMCAFANAQPQSKAPSPTPTPEPQNATRAKTKSNQANDIWIKATRELVVISLDLPKPEAFTYNPATGEIKPMTGEIQAQVNPIPGVGVVIKKNPGGGASITIPVQDGKGELPLAHYASHNSEAEHLGSYDLVITIPQGSLPGKPPASERKGVTITFAMMKTPDGWVHEKASIIKIAEAR